MCHSSARDRRSHLMFAAEADDHNWWLFSSGSQRRWPLSLPVLTLIFPALLPCLVRDSLCTALQTKILQTLPPPPDHSPLFASIRWPGQAGLTSAGSVAAGSDGCLLGRIHFPCGYVVYVLLCCWGVFPVLTLYSPRSIVWGLFFSPHFPHVNAVFFFNSTCISLLIILVWLCMWRIRKNLEGQLCPPPPPPPELTQREKSLTSLDWNTLIQFL